MCNGCCDSSFVFGCFGVIQIIDSLYFICSKFTDMDDVMEGDEELNEVELKSVEIFVSLFGLIVSALFIVYFSDMVKKIWALVYAFMLKIVLALGYLVYLFMERERIRSGHQY